MIQSGTRPLPYDRRDYDLHKTFGAALAPEFPTEYNVENGLWTPNQNTGGEVFNLKSMPYGCTNYTQADICADDDCVLYNPGVLEEYTHANAKGGLDIRISLKAVTLKDKLKDIQGQSGLRRTAYFSIKPTYPLDWFDSIRLALLSTKEEGRSASVGTPFFMDWGNPLPNGVLRIPASFDITHVPWHNFKISGWRTIDGVPYLICKMWAGPNYGDKGFVYMSRELTNAVLSINGACAFTVTKLTGLEPQRVDLEVINWIVSLIRWVFKFDEPVITPLPMETPKPAPTPIKETAAERIAEAATAALGKDVTPDDKVPDEVACVASLVAILPEEFGISRKLTYTPDLQKALEASNKKFKRASYPLKGTIVVSPTRGDVVGHCGIYVTDNEIASNNSFDNTKGGKGIWSQNYTRQSWVDFFGNKKGLRGYLYHPV